MNLTVETYYYSKNLMGDTSSKDCVEFGQNTLLDKIYFKCRNVKGGDYNVSIYDSNNNPIDFFFWFSPFGYKHANLSFGSHINELKSVEIINNCHNYAKLTTKNKDTIILEDKLDFIDVQIISKNCLVYHIKYFQETNTKSGTE